MNRFALLVVLAGCRIGFHESASTVAMADAGVDTTNDAPLGTRVVTFGERTSSMVTNVTTDAYVVQAVGYDTLNYGATTDLSAYGNVERGLLRFDLSSLTSADIVVEATLELHIEDSNDQIGGLFQVMRLEESWVEGSGDGTVVPGATWLTRDGSTAWSSLGGTATLNLAVESVGAIAGPVSFVLPAANMQAWIDAPATNHGVMLLSANGGHWHVTSRDHPAAADRPELRLVLQDP